MTGIVSAENGLIPIVDPVGAALSILLGGAGAVLSVTDTDSGQKVIRHQAEESDFDFLKRISKENGWEMFIEHSGPLGGYQLRFMSPLDRLAPEVSLEIRAFSDRVQPAPHHGRAARLCDRLRMGGSHQDPVYRHAGLGLGPGCADPGCAPGSHAHAERPQRLLDQRTGHARFGAAQADQRADPQAEPAPDRLWLVHRRPAHPPRRRDPARGLGEEFGGYYRVTSATHSIDSGGYRTNFDVRKEIWFGSIPLPEQGAVPLSLKGPFG